MLKKINKTQTNKMFQLEIILNVFTKQANYIIPKIKYYKGLRVVCGIASANVEPINQNIKLPVMITNILPLDITNSVIKYRTYMLKYDIVPSNFAAGYYDSGVQLGQIIKLNLQINVINFCNRLTIFNDEKSVQYAGAWIDHIVKRNTNANYRYIYTYDPIFNTKEKIVNYYKRSPWMPILSNSASMPYYITNAFWVEPKQWLIYYSSWRYFPELKNMPKYLKYYLGMDKSDYQEGEKNEFTITGYASNVLSIYYKKKYNNTNNKEYPVFFIPKDKENIFAYPFDATDIIII
jgi:hypothetical protein